MSWKYQISTGQLTDPTGKVVGTGYSGKEGIWRNNPATEPDVAEGPIPRGLWHIGPAYSEIPGTGPVTMALNPEPSTKTYGRSLFRIHGDNVKHDASHGCIILALVWRLLIAASKDRALLVTP